MVMVASVCIHRYLPHLRKSISLGGRDMDWVNAAKHPQLLTYYSGSETLGRKFKGTTDVVLADRMAIRTFQPERGLRLLFELKKAVEKADVIQAQASMLLANVHSPELRPMMVSPDPSLSQVRVLRLTCLQSCIVWEILLHLGCLSSMSEMQLTMAGACVGSYSAFLSSWFSVSSRTAMMTHTCPIIMPGPQYMIEYANFNSPSSDGLILLQVLTDLADNWQLVWLDGSTIYQHAFKSRGEAVGFLDAFLTGRLQADEGIEADVARVLKRQKINDRLIATTEAGDNTLFGDQMQSLEGFCRTTSSCR